MEVKDVNSIKDDNNELYNMMTLFNKQYEDGKFCKFGKVIIPPGVKIPDSGLTRHDADEFSIVIKGAIDVTCGGKTIHADIGTALHIPMNEEHMSANNYDEDCEIIWALVK